MRRRSPPRPWDRPLCHQIAALVRTQRFTQSAEVVGFRIRAFALAQASLTLGRPTRRAGLYIEGCMW